ncbi:MAG: hypothetical protein Q9169_008766, partial [Polycauliona sp. 2 TL-2023]
SGVDVVVTVLEAEDDDEIFNTTNSERGGREEVRGGINSYTTLSLLSACITVSSAAIADAGIDCVDLVSGGVAAIVRQPPHPSTPSAPFPTNIILDPSPSSHTQILAICVVGYLRSRDQITESWSKGDCDIIDDGAAEEGETQSGFERLLERAVEAAVESRLVMDKALREAAEWKVRGLEMERGKGSG